jgi:hypothetical protein
VKLLPLLSVLAMIACTSHAGPTQPAAPAPPTAPGQGATMAQLKAAIGAAGCTSNAECKSIGVGAKPCGGPGAYIAWSQRDANAELVRTLAARTTEERKAQIAARGEMGICRVTPDPGASCVIPAGATLGQCALGGTSSAQ